MGEFIDCTKGFPPTPPSDVCIVGAGAAGITLALQLAGQGKKVTLIESGNFEMEGTTQYLYHGENIGLPYKDLLSCRLRYFGGTTNHWGGVCRNNDPEDHEPRPDLGLPGWPVSHAELLPYVNHAAKMLGMEVDDWDPERQRQKLKLDRNSLEKHSPDISTKVFQRAKVRVFAKEYREDILSNPYINVLLNANLTQVNLSQDGAEVESLAVATLSGFKAKLKAGQYVLACHAIENARLLLLSNNVSKNGIGNDYGHVGQNFMEHPHLYSSSLLPTDHSMADFFTVGKLATHGSSSLISLSNDCLKREGILPYYCRLRSMYDNKGFEGAENLSKRFMEPLDLEMLRSASDVLSDLGGLVRGVKNKVKRGANQPSYFVLDHRIAQSPNPRSRVVLRDEKDALGLRKADLNWELNDIDYRTFQVGQRIVSNVLIKSGVGRIRLNELTKEYVDENVDGHNHHTGTTRMSNNPQDGVVDRNCRIHGVRNLYVSGSSIFPRIGFSGPTMLIVALSIRLAEHLSNEKNDV
ncbi:MAG: GMC family oxidoreductase [Verrucomicrobiota bacterium]